MRRWARCCSPWRGGAAARHRRRVRLLAAVLVLSIAGVHRPDRGTGPRTTIRRDVAEGVGWLWRHRFLRGLTLVSASTSLVQSMTTGVLVLFALDDLGVGEAGYGLLLTAEGSAPSSVDWPPRRWPGGSAAPPRWSPARSSARSPSARSGFTDNALVAGVLVGLEMAGVLFWNVLTMSLRQALIPEELFGRVQGGYRTLVGGGSRWARCWGGARRRHERADRLRRRGGPLFLLAGVLWRLLVVHRDLDRRRLRRLSIPVARRRDASCAPEPAHVGLPMIDRGATALSGTTVTGAVAHSGTSRTATAPITLVPGLLQAPTRTASARQRVGDPGQLVTGSPGMLRYSISMPSRSAAGPSSRRSSASDLGGGVVRHGLRRGQPAGHRRGAASVTWTATSRDRCRRASPAA